MARACRCFAYRSKDRGYYGRVLRPLSLSRRLCVLCAYVEPAHPFIAEDLAILVSGKGMAVPIGAILTSAMMLEYLGFHLEAVEPGRSVRGAVSANETTRDLGRQLSTEQVGSAILARLASR